MQARGFECRIFQAAYYINVNGGLTASDLLNSLALDPAVEKIDNSVLFKKEFVDKVVKRKPDQVLAFKGDTDVLQEMQNAVKACAPKLDAVFYELPKDFAEVPVSTASKQAQMQA